MAVLSNNGRLISTLPATSIISATDEFLIQSNGITKRTSYAALTSSILSAASFNPFINQVKFTNVNNKFTGSFYGNVYGTSTGTNITITAGDGLSGGGILTSNRSLAVDSTVVRTSGTQTVGGSKTFSSTILGNITSTGTSTFSTIDVNGGTIDGTTVGASSATTIIGTTITANTGFVGSLTGNVTGNLTGDVYNSTTTKVLESGNTTTTPNGGVSSAYFYGTSSYANQALTAAYATTGGTIVNGLPVGGTQYQVLAKNTSTNYDVSWTTPISATGGPSQYDMTMWNGSYVIKTAPGFTYAVASDLYVFNKSVNTNNGLTGSIHGVVTSPLTTVTISSAITYTINGDLYPSVVLDVQATGATVTVRLRTGKTCTVLIKNNGAYSISTWNTSTNGGATTTSLYWKNGTTPTITSGAAKLDVFTFVNINNYVLGSSIQNFS
jgi:hypothetical protein